MTIYAETIEDMIFDVAHAIADWMVEYGDDPQTDYCESEYWMERFNENAESVYEDVDAYGNRIMAMYDEDSEAEKRWLDILDDINEIAIVID